MKVIFFPFILFFSTSIIASELEFCGLFRHEIELSESLIETKEVCYSDPWKGDESCFDEKIYEYKFRQSKYLDKKILIKDFNISEKSYNRIQYFLMQNSSLDFCAFLHCSGHISSTQLEYPYENFYFHKNDNVCGMRIFN
jgi:hypothetical protein